MTDTKGKYPPPFLECSHHPGRQRSYISCIHVLLQHQPVAYVELATDDIIGVCCCEQCNQRVLESKGECDLADLRPICEGCASDAGLLIRGAVV